MNAQKVPKNILIATTMRPDSDAVVRVGVELAQRLGAVPILFHALDIPLARPAIAAITDVLAEAAWRERLNTSSKEALAEQAGRLGVLAAGGRYEMVPGDPADSLAQWASTLESCLILIGRGQAARRWRLLGSTADRVVRKSACPVWVLHPEAAFPPRSVLAPVDFSELSGGALRQGLAAVSRLGVVASNVEVLFVLERAEHAGSLHFSPDHVERFAKEELQRFVATHGGDQAGLLRRRLTFGQPRDGILEVAAEDRPDLIVVGTQSRRGLDRLLLGSVATAVLYSTETSLLIVPPEAAHQALEPDYEGADWTYVSDDQPQAKSA